MESCKAERRELSNGDGHGQVPTGELVRRDFYLHRFGLAATLMVVEHIRQADGSITTRRRFSFWPGM
jgi:hypothetical protein